MYHNLKMQMWKSGIRQNRLAQLVGIHETQLSRIVNGFREPNAEIRAKIAKALECDEQWIFLSEPPRKRALAAAPEEIADSYAPAD